MFQVLRKIAIFTLAAGGFSALLAAQAAGPGAASPGQQAGAAGQASGPVATSPHALQLDAEHRPITEGGFVKTGPVVFEDISERAGLTKWTHKMGTPAKN